MSFHRFALFSQAYAATPKGHEIMGRYGTDVVDCPGRHRVPGGLLSVGPSDRRLANSQRAGEDRTGRLCATDKSDDLRLIAFPFSAPDHRESAK